MPDSSTEAIELTVCPLDREDVFHDMVRVHLDHRPFSNAGAVIIVDHKGKKARLVARGAPKNSKTDIWLDLRSRQKLGLKPNTKAHFVFQQASLCDEFRWAWSATDAMPRIAARLGLISVGLGLLGGFLGALSLWLAS